MEDNPYASPASDQATASVHAFAQQSVRETLATALFVGVMIGARTGALTLLAILAVLLPWDYATSADSLAAANLAIEAHSWLIFVSAIVVFSSLFGAVAGGMLGIVLGVVFWSLGRRAKEPGTTASINDSATASNARLSRHAFSLACQTAWAVTGAVSAAWAFYRKEVDGSMVWIPWMAAIAISTAGFAFGGRRFARLLRGGLRLEA